MLKHLGIIAGACGGVLLFLVGLGFSISQGELSTATTILVALGAVIIAAPAVDNFRISATGVELKTINRLEDATNGLKGAATDINEIVKQHGVAIEALAKAVSDLEKSFSKLAEQQGAIAEEINKKEEFDLTEVIKQTADIISKSDVNVRDFVAKGREAVAYVGPLYSKISGQLAALPEVKSQ